MIDCRELAGDLLEPPIKIRRVSVQLVELAAGLLGLGSYPVERLLKLRTAVRYSDASAPSGDSSSDDGMFASSLSKTPHTPEPMWRASNRMLIMADGGDGEPLDYTELERWTRVGFERGMASRRGER